MTFEELKNKAHSLPAEPGVYIMRNEAHEVIYVGKAKRLKNRVSSYFVDSSSHSLKTRVMVSKIFDFDVIVAASEFEALVLECSLIKRHAPRYNILLKDDKGYPYIRLDSKKEYPVFSVANKILNDGAEYFGPFGSRSTTNTLLEAVISALKLPKCGKVFPRDIGKGRPCLNFHIQQCAGWCRGALDRKQYMQAVEQAKMLFRGDHKKVSDDIKTEMIKAADALDFEMAAMLRDRYKAISALSSKQFVTAAACYDTDVIGYAQNEIKACFTILHFSGGNLAEKDYEIFAIPDTPTEAVSSLIIQYYAAKGYLPKNIYLPFALEDSSLIEQYFLENFKIKTALSVPQRGDKLRLVELASKNAEEEVQRITTKEDRHAGILALLAKMLSAEPPNRIESYDISNISGTDTVGSMVVFCDARPAKSQYKRFKIEETGMQDDYGSMRQMLQRRLKHFLAADPGFEQPPDLMLIDGGVAHAGVARQLLDELGLCWPVFGMVKDDRHRTRALVTPEGEQISIDSNQAVFSFIGTIQEETHRFAITYHKSLRSKRLRYSQLDQIPGIGPKRKQDLLKSFKSISAIRAASLMELERILPKPTAAAVYDYFNNEGDDL